MEIGNEEWTGELNTDPSLFIKNPENHTGYFLTRSGINYSFVFFYERKFFQEEFSKMGIKWVSESWTRGWVYAILYLLLIFAGREFMKTREKREFRQGLIAWNLVLSLFSFVGAIRLWPELIHTIRTHGLEHSYCNRDFAHGVFGFWITAFAGSKLPELIDTFFIVVRKQKLIFLHWFHHFTVLIYSWYSFIEFTSSGRWFGLINYSIHAVMYGYYACRAMRFNIPRWVNITITSGQIIQMLVGIYINLSAYSAKINGRACAISYNNIWWSFFMYLSYFVLFSLFFLKSYISQPKKESTVKNKDN